MIKLNKESLVEQSVIGEIQSPMIGSNPYTIGSDGELRILPGVGGISYNVRIGDRVCGLMADHVEPCVTIKNQNETANGALNVLSCIGNKAYVVTGDAKGNVGYVTGKHGGCEHVLIDFKPEVLDKLVIGDKIQIRSFGVGLKFEEEGVEKDIKIFNIDPNLLEKINYYEEGGKINFPVTHYIPAGIMGSGLGRNNVSRGDYDIQLFDEKIKEEYNLDLLRFGDFVAIIDADNSYGRIYKTGAITIGVVVHSDCYLSGHGPGVTTIMTSSTGQIRPFIDKESNLKKYLYN